MTFSTLLKDYIPKRPLIRKLNDTFCIHHPCYKYQYFVALSGHHAPSWKWNFEKTCFSPKNDICMRCTPLDWTFFGMKVEDIPSSLYTCTTLLATFKDTALFFVCKRTMSEMKSCISGILKKSVKIKNPGSPDMVRNTYNRNNIMGDHSHSLFTI